MKKRSHILRDDRVVKKLREKIAFKSAGSVHSYRLKGDLKKRYLLLYGVSCGLDGAWFLSRIFSKRYGIGGSLLEWELKVVDQLDVWERDDGLAWPICFEIVLRKSSKTRNTKAQIERAKKKLVELIDLYLNENKGFMIAVKAHHKKIENAVYEWSVKKLMTEIKTKSMEELLTSSDSLEKEVGLFLRRRHEEGL